MDDYVPEKKKKRSGGKVWCSARGCSTKGGGGVSFFRIPKLEPNCTQWKEALGFVGNHKFANLTPEQCNRRIKICKLHFSSNCFSSENRIHMCAIPSLFLNGFEAERDDEFVEGDDSVTKASQTTDREYPFYGQTIALQKKQRTPIETARYKMQLKNADASHSNDFRFIRSSEPPPLAPILNVKSESIIDIQPSQIVKTESDDSLDSTNFEPLLPDETFQKDQTTQTPIEFTPILIVKEGAQDGLDQNPKTNIEDVYKFFENNYSAEACSLLKAQIDVLEKKKKTAGVNGLPIDTSLLKHISVRKV